MAQKTFGNLPEALNVGAPDILAIEQSDATRKVTFENFTKQIYTPEIAEQTAEFPEITKDDTLPVIAGKIRKWQQDALKKIEDIGFEGIQSFPTDEFNPENPDDPITKALMKQVISALLAYTMNDKILKVVSDHGTLQADFEIQKREQMASYGYFGVEWDIDDLMTLVKAGKWDKFAIGDYFIETNSAGEKIQFEVTGKNSYLHCGDQGNGLTEPHIVASPRDCLQTYYKFNTSNANGGGYAGSLMPANLETEAKKFSSKLQGYMTTIRRLENNKSTWAWASRRIFLMGVVEALGQLGWADMWSGGGFNQLPLFVGGNAHLLKGAGFNKSKAARMWWWLADPSAANTTYFCRFSTYGASDRTGASNDGGIAPLIVLS